MRLSWVCLAFLAVASLQITSVRSQDAQSSLDGARPSVDLDKTLSAFYKFDDVGKVPADATTQNSAVSTPAAAAAADSNKDCGLTPCEEAKMAREQALATLNIINTASGMTTAEDLSRRQLREQERQDYLDERARDRVRSQKLADEEETETKRAAREEELAADRTAHNTQEELEFEQQVRDIQSMIDAQVNREAKSKQWAIEEKENLQLSADRMKAQATHEEDSKARAKRELQEHKKHSVDARIERTKERRLQEWEENTMENSTRDRINEMRVQNGLAALKFPDVKSDSNRPPATHQEKEEASAAARKAARAAVQVETLQHVYAMYMEGLESVDANVRESQDRTLSASRRANGLRLLVPRLVTSLGNAQLRWSQVQSKMTQAAEVKLTRQNASLTSAEEFKAKALAEEAKQAEAAKSELETRLVSAKADLTSSEEQMNLAQKVQTEAKVAQKHIRDKANATYVKMQAAMVPMQDTRDKAEEIIASHGTDIREVISKVIESESKKQRDLDASFVLAEKATLRRLVDTVVELSRKLKLMEEEALLKEKAAIQAELDQAKERSKQAQKLINQEMNAILAKPKNQTSMNVTVENLEDERLRLEHHLTNANLTKEARAAAELRLKQLRVDLERKKDEKAKELKEREAREKARIAEELRNKKEKIQEEDKKTFAKKLAKEREKAAREKKGEIMAMHFASEITQDKVKMHEMEREAKRSLEDIKKDKEFKLRQLEAKQAAKRLSCVRKSASRPRRCWCKRRRRRRTRKLAWRRLTWLPRLSSLLARPTPRHALSVARSSTRRRCWNSSTCSTSWTRPPRKTSTTRTSVSWRTCKFGWIIVVATAQPWRSTFCSRTRWPLCAMRSSSAVVTLVRCSPSCAARCARPKACHNGTVSSVSCARLNSRSSAVNRSSVVSSSSGSSIMWIWTASIPTLRSRAFRGKLSRIITPANTPRRIANKHKRHHI